MKVKRFLVISIDDENNQTFLDLVKAKNEEAAMILAAKVRTDAWICEALSKDKLDEIRLRLEHGDDNDFITCKNIKATRKLFGYI